jgi:hypothetical protein
MSWSVETPVQGNGQASGGALLKVVVRESYLDLNATEATIQRNLSNLDDYI